MFDRWKKKPQNSLEQMSLDELRTARVKLERTRDRLMADIRKLDQAKSDHYAEGRVQPDLRSQRMLAQRVKEADEQIRQLDQQLRYCDKYLQIIYRLEFLKRNQAQMMELGIDELLGKMKAGDLRKDIDDFNISGAVKLDLLNEISDLLGEAMGDGFVEEDPEIARIMEEMQIGADAEFSSGVLNNRFPDEDEEPPRRQERAS